MASIHSYPDSSCIFMGNPIVYAVVPGKVPGENVSFHRVKMIVKFSTYEYELSQPVDKDTEIVEFDISNCFMSQAELFEFQPLTQSGVKRTFPVFTTTSITIKDVWVENGLQQEGGQQSLTNHTAIMGAYSDYERLHTVLTPTYSRKPLSPELALADDLVVFPSGEGLTPSSTAVNISFIADSEINLNGRSYYIVSNPVRSAQFQFVNSRGCLETIRAWNVEQEKMKSEKKTTVISKFERFNDFSRTHIAKHVQPAEFSCSSGFVDYEWARWWAYEFGASRQHWWLVDGSWIPCKVTVDDSLSVIDRSKVQMCSVQFTVSPDINGALW